MFESMKSKVVGLSVGAATFATPLMAFAAEGDLIDYATLAAPIITTVSSAVTALLPVGITLMTISIGISMIPRIVYRFF